MSKQEFSVPPQSYWIASTESTKFPQLNDSVSVDVAVIGGGLAGITSAYLLKQSGLKVAVIESDKIGQGTTGHTTAKITSQHGLIYDKIKTSMGLELAQQYADSNQYAVKFISEVVQKNNIDCDFSWQSAYVYTQDDKYIKNISDEANTASTLGIQSKYIENLPIKIPIKAALRFDNQAQFHPRKYLLALANTIPGDDSFIFEQTRSLDIEYENQCIVYTDLAHKVFAKKVIVASHFPFYDGMRMYFSRIFPYRSYALGIKVSNTFPGGMYISAEDPGRSIRSQPYGDDEILIISGEHHKTGQGSDTKIHYSNLVEFAKENFTIDEILFRWSTQDYTTMDYVPYIGQISSNKSNIFIATGFKKWGMTTSTVSALIFKDLIVDGKSQWSEVYNPSRFTPKASAKSFVIENLNVAKELVLGKLEINTEDIDISTGEGKVVEIKGKRVGVYKDTNGRIHAVDTTCTHMGCELQWNSAELSWDCPCHGSRFTYEGEIIEGPALKKLKGEKGKDE